MKRLLCCHRNCPVAEEVDVPIGVSYPSWYCRDHRSAFSDFSPKGVKRDRIKWLLLSATEYHSETGQPGSGDKWVPDYYVYRQEPGKWYVKWRTSAMRSGPFESHGEAKLSCERD